MAQRLILFLTALGVACGGAPAEAPAPSPAAPLPTAGLAGQSVAVTPLTLFAVDDTMGWVAELTPRRAVLDHADSVLGALLTERSPEVTWVLPPALRRAAERAPGILASPDQLGTALLRHPQAQVPDPLRSQLRALAGVAGSRYVLVPAALVFRPADGGGRAELILVLADVRTGLIGWRTVAHATRDAPWPAFEAAVRSLVPGLP
ncbi:MAG: hypothetical protein WD934_01015 [Gemmatimonadales bacterium]